MSARCFLQVMSFALLSGSVGLAHAQDTAPAPAPAPVTKADLFPEKPPAPRKWSVTTFPLLLFAPILEVTVERRLHRNLGVAFMLGGGSFTAKADTAGGADNKIKLFEVGTSVRYYGLGSFRKGLQFGAAVEYVRLTGDNLDGSMVSAVGSGLLLAGFLGYKYTWSFGLTLEGQLGPAFVAIRGETDDGAVQESDSRVIAYYNFNAGWSF